MGYSPWGHKESDTTEQLSTCGSIEDEADPSVNFLMCHVLYNFGALFLFFFFFFFEKPIGHTLLLFFILHFFYLLKF